GHAQAVASGVFGADEFKRDLAALSPQLGAAALCVLPDPARSREAETVEGAIKMMASHVPQLSRAEVEPGAPAHGMVGAFQIGARFPDPEPEIPVKALGQGIGLAFALGRLGPPVQGLVFPKDDFLDLADGPASQEFNSGAILETGAPLVPQLSHHALLLGLLPQHPAFVHRCGEGLLYVDVLLGAHRAHRDGSVHVVWWTNHEGIEAVRCLGEEL